MHTRTRVRNARARTRVERKNMLNLKRIADALECLVVFEHERNEMIKQDIENEKKFKENYTSIMSETSNQLIGKIGEQK